MNIFEALEKGDGKVILIGCKYNTDFYAFFEDGKFCWKSKILGKNYVELHDLKRNDWIPYVPRETCSNCGFPSYLSKKVKLTPDWVCNECGRLFNFEIVPPLKAKHKEVFEEVVWIRVSGQVARESVATIYPHIIKSPLAFDKFAWKKTKMTLEWEE